MWYWWLQINWLLKLKENYFGIKLRDQRPQTPVVVDKELEAASLPWWRRWWVSRATTAVVLRMAAVLTRPPVCLLAPLTLVYLPLPLSSSTPPAPCFPLLSALSCSWLLCCCRRCCWANALAYTGDAPWSPSQCEYLTKFSCFSTFIRNDVRFR